MEKNTTQSFDEFMASLEPKFYTENSDSVLFYLLKEKKSARGLYNAFDEYFETFAEKTVICDYIYGGSHLPASNIIRNERALKQLFVELVEVGGLEDIDIQTFVDKYVETLYSRLSYNKKDETIFVDSNIVVGAKVVIGPVYYYFPIKGMYFYDTEILLAMTNELALRKLNLDSIKKAVTEIPFTFARDAKQFNYPYSNNDGISKNTQKELFDENIQKIKEIIANPELAKPNPITPREQRKANKDKPQEYRKSEKKYSKKASLLKRILGRVNDLEI